MFIVNLSILGALEKPLASSLSDQSSSINEVLMEICNELYKYSEMIVFSINGFDKDWSNLMIDPDLCMFMEDMPGLVNFINNKEVLEFQFGFPEQHLQRILTATRVSNEFQISCSDWLSESSEQIKETIRPEDLRKTLQELVKKIRVIVDQIHPTAYENTYFKDWLNQVEV
jgi:hypothetical protein